MSDVGVEKTSTIPHRADGALRWWETGLRRFTVGLLGIVVGLAMFGMLGVRTTTATAEGNGYRLEVLHGAVTRGGLATPFEVTVEAEDGLPDVVTLRVGSAYLAMFDENGLDPTPVESYADEQWTYWTFAVPEGAKVLTVDFDARLEPAVQWGESTEVAVVEGARSRVAVTIRTWVAP